MCVGSDADTLIMYKTIRVGVGNYTGKILRIIGMTKHLRIMLAL